MQASLKPIQVKEQELSDRVDFRIGFRNKKKKTLLLGFALVRKSIIGHFIF